MKSFEIKDYTFEGRYVHAVNLIRSFLEKKEPFLDNWTQKNFKIKGNISVKVHTKP